MIVKLIFEIIINKNFRIIITFEVLNMNFKNRYILKYFSFQKINDRFFFCLLLMYVTETRFFSFKE
jgi:hypothetical protein